MLDSEIVIIMVEYVRSIFVVKLIYEFFHYNIELFLTMIKRKLQLKNVTLKSILNLYE